MTLIVHSPLSHLVRGRAPTLDRYVILTAANLPLAFRYGAQYFPLSRDPRWPFDRSVIPGCRHGSLQRSGCELVGGADGCGIHLVVGEDAPDAMVAIASVCLSP